MEAHNSLVATSDTSRLRGRGASNLNRGSIIINNSGGKGFRKGKGSGGKGLRKGGETTC
jgi:hypothetical protein